MFSLFDGLVARALKLPAEPDAPPGDHSTVRTFLASKRFFYYRLVTAGLALFWLTLVLVLPLGGAALALSEQSVALAALLLAALVAFWFLFLFFKVAMVRLDYRRRWYLVTDQAIRIREGVSNVHELTIRHRNVQNVKISQGPLQRLMGIKDVQIEVAGGGVLVAGQQQQTLMSHGAVFRGVDNAEEIRTQVMECVKAVRDSGVDEKKAPTRSGFSRQECDVLAEILAEVRQLQAGNRG